MADVCRSGCRAKDHASYADCLQAAGTKIAMGAQIRSNTDKELANYRAARAAGIQPAGTRQSSIDQANAISDKYGAAFNSEDGTVGGKPTQIIEMGG